MTTFLLVPGRGADPSYWRFVVAGLAARGHRGVAIDLPCEDDAAGLDAYADAVADLFYNGVDAAASRRTPNALSRIRRRCNRGPRTRSLGYPPAS